MTTIFKRNASDPTETRVVPNGKMALVAVGENTFACGTLEPGWRWSEHIKPLVGGDSCQVRHVGYVLSGRMCVKADDGTEVEIGPGDFHDILPGHDAWVVGDKQFVGLDFGIGNVAAVAKTILK